ncbi:MAG: tetratricopeptide repeat protein [Candidatus Kapabacteria bacterium]|jgi:signal transduction histidine kinase/Tfp pilus assembly protein PilF|nr:tetratricopeptide repeat protein [Candidatus Kapabacteria bacterium]
MKYCFLFLLLFASWHFPNPEMPNIRSIQQSGERDSLHRVLVTAKHDTTLISAMIELSWYYLSVASRYDSSMIYAKEAQKLAKKIGSKKWAADALSTMASINLVQGKYKDALEYYMKLLPVREELGSKAAIASNLSNIGVVYYQLGNYKDALDYYGKSLRIREEIGNAMEICTSLNNIGVVYYQQGKYGQALEYYSKALRIYEAQNSKKDIAMSLRNMGIVYAEQGRYSEALENYFKSLRLLEELGIKDKISASLRSIGNVYFRQGRYSEALEYQTKSLRINQKIANKVGIAEDLRSIGDNYLTQGKYSEAIEVLLKALKLHEELGEKKNIATTLNSIGEIYKAQGKYQESLSCYQRSLGIQEETGDKVRVSQTLNHIGSAYRMLRNFDNTIFYSLRALRLADSLGARPQKRDAFEALSICYDSLGQHKRALEYHRQFVALKDSIVNAESLEKTAKLRESYDAEKREQQIALLSKETEILSKDKSLKESEIARQQAELARADAVQLVQEQSIRLLVNDKELRQLTLKQQEAALTEARLREERSQEALKLAAAQSALQRVELSRRSLIQWVLAAMLLAVAGGAVWFGVLYRQKSQANSAILQQQKLLEEQAIEIQMANHELHQQNEELFALNNEKNEIMGIVSHDLKNPIGAVRSYAELIQSQILSPEEVPGAIEHIVQVSDRMLELVKNLLDMNQLETGGLHLHPISFDITSVVEATVYQYQTPAQAKNITLHFHATDEEHIVLADEQVTMQVLDNLISNAVKYSPHGKNVYVRLQSSEGAVRLEVQDEGQGISADDMKKLFGKFARLSARPTGGEHSTGLGLSIVKKMVEAMNGRVWCESELGKGATFIVELPKVT